MMYHTASRIHEGRRLIGLAILVSVGLLTSMVLTTHTAHAQQAMSTTITDCSSDAQLQSAVASAASGDTITFGCSGDIKLTQALTISTNLTLDGSGQNVTLDGQGNGRVLTVLPGVSFTLDALIVAHGSDSGLINGGTVTINNSTFTNNSSNSGGGGIYNYRGTVTINNSTFANNSARNSGGGLFTFGGTVTISTSTFANNSAATAGGLDNYGGRVAITTSTFANNSSSRDVGGGIFNEIGGTATINTSTFTNNSASFNGGGLYNEGTATISNSTFANNSARNSGGGLYNNPTFGGTITVSGSIVSSNTGGNCAGSVSDRGYNLESSTDCGFTGTGGLQNTDPKLDPNGLQSNGGPTQTLALLAGSPASDHIPSAQCPTTDQRGTARLDNGETTCDIGAYEFIDPDTDLALTNMPANITVDATSPAGAVVTYTPPTATDEAGDNPGPSVSCSPASGSTFAIGTTTVTCTATDSDDTNSPVSGSFTVTVNGAAIQINNLITTINNFHLQKAIQASLDLELQVAQAALAHNKLKVACAALDLFLLEVTKLTGHGITASQAGQVLASARQIQAVIGR